MSGKINKNTQPQRREYDNEFKRQAVQMLVDGHSAASIVDRLGISGTNLLYRWRQQQVGKAGPVASALGDRVRELEAELRRVERKRDILKKALIVFGRAD